MTTGKIIALTIQTFVGKVMSLLFNMLSTFVIAFLPRSKHLLISWLHSQFTVILEPNKIKTLVSIVSPYICHKMMVPDVMILAFWMLSFKPALSCSSFTFNKRLFNSFLLSVIMVVSSAYLRLLIFLLVILIPAVFQSAWHFTYKSHISLHISQISRVKIYNFDVLLSKFWTSLLFHVWF